MRSWLRESRLPVYLPSPNEDRYLKAQHSRAMRRVAASDVEERAAECDPRGDHDDAMWARFVEGEEIDEGRENIRAILGARRITFEDV